MGNKKNQNRQHSVKRNKVQGKREMNPNTVPPDKDNYANMSDGMVP